jgi:hypothetical protein
VLELEPVKEALKQVQKQRASQITTLIPGRNDSELEMDMESVGSRNWGMRPTSEQVFSMYKRIRHA